MSAIVAAAVDELAAALAAARGSLRAGDAGEACVSEALLIEAEQLAATAASLLRARRSQLMEPSAPLEVAREVSERIDAAILR